MNILTRDQADGHLRAVGMCLGAWNEIRDLPRRAIDSRARIALQAPKNAMQLFNLSLHVAGWLPSGAWVLVQLDNSNAFDAVQENFFRSLLPQSSVMMQSLMTSRSFLFQFDGPDKFDATAKLLIAHLSFALLLFEGHGHIVSSGSTSGELVSIQDGTVYFSSRRKDISEANELVKGFANDPAAPARWTLRLIEAAQDNQMLSSHNDPDRKDLI